MRGTYWAFGCRRITSILTITISSIAAVIPTRKEITSSSGTVRSREVFMKRFLQIAAICISALLLVFVFVFLFMESRWAKPRHFENHEAFLYGPTGTELMPLAVFKV